MATWVTAMGDLPEGAAVPVAARRRAEFTRAVVEAATSRPDKDASWLSAVRCTGASGCAGRVEVHEDFDHGEVRWRCATCGDEGVVRGWEHSEHDLSDFMPFDDQRPWLLDEAEHELLLGATRGLPDLRAVIMRASPHATEPRLLVADATVEELDELYTLVEELADAARRGRERELLDGLRASLCTTMDDF
jgi:hypothetical protein